jgi:hypothetical protein
MYLNQSLILNSRAAEMAKLQTPNNLRALQLAREGKGPRPANTVMGKKGQIEFTLPAADAVIYNEAAELAFRRSGAAYDASRAKIIEELTQLHSERAGKTTDPLAKTPQGIAAAAEIRQHLKSLPPGERAALVRAEIAAGNNRVASAVCDSESWLSGLDAATHSNLVAATHSQFSKEESEKISALNAVLKTVDDAAMLSLNGWTESIVPVLGLNDAASSALSALKNGESV